VSYAGISDLAEFMHRVRDRQGDDSWAFDYWVKWMGTDRILGAKELHDRSPARFADQVKASVLLIHGKDDTVVDIKQSKIMYKALKKAGKEVEFIALDGEDHWLSVESSRIETLKAMEGFLAKHLRPIPEAH
jgi:dipeptidyl aminopeptidase/acylaminoacyl peptidase